MASPVWQTETRSRPVASASGDGFVDIAASDS
jgi:hypothetical protein